MNYNFFDEIKKKLIDSVINITYNKKIPEDFKIFVLFNTNIYQNNYQIFDSNKIKIDLTKYINKYYNQNFSILSNYRNIDCNNIIKIGFSNCNYLKINLIYDESISSKISRKINIKPILKYKNLFNINILSKKTNKIIIQIIRIDQNIGWNFDLKILISSFIKIPKHIYYTLPNKNLLNMEETKKTLTNIPGYINHFYDDKECLKFIEKHFSYDIYICYCQLIPGAFKADFWRLCILYINGGIYIDLGMKIIEDLDQIVEYNELVLVKDRGIYGIFNAFICSVPKHPFIKLCLDKLCYKIKQFDYSNHPLGFSGPIFIKEIYDKWKYKQKIHFYYHNENGNNIKSIENINIITTKNGEKKFNTKYNKNKICLLRKEFIDSIGNKIEAYHYDILWEKKIVFYSIYYGSWSKSAKDYHIKNDYLYSRLKNINEEWIENRIKLKPFQKYCNINGKFSIE